MSDPLHERVSEASEDELKEMFGTLMSKARGHRAMDGHIVMLLDYDDEGNITREHYVIRQRGSYVPADRARKYDHTFAVETDAFMSYEDIQESFLRRWRKTQ